MKRWGANYVIKKEVKLLLLAIGLVIVFANPFTNDIHDGTAPTLVSADTLQKAPTLFSPTTRQSPRMIKSRDKLLLPTKEITRQNRDEQDNARSNFSSQHGKYYKKKNTTKEKLNQKLGI